MNQIMTHKTKIFFRSILIMALALIALTACSTKDKKESGSSDKAAQYQNASGDLEIPVSEISDKASFYPVTADGTKMEVLAVKAPDGTIRTAFNTCQICFGSGRGYYKQEGDKLVCQNCGNQFSMDLVEVEAGGCNPWPIFDKNKTVTDESITIPSDFLKESEQIFANWKKSY
ncbi:hypothetical protein LXJ15735_18190 [Lacrimispora xylanolytica]